MQMQIIQVCSKGKYKINIFNLKPWKNKNEHLIDSHQDVSWKFQFKYVTQYPSSTVCSETKSERFRLKANFNPKNNLKKICISGNTCCILGAFPWYLSASLLAVMAHSCHYDLYFSISFINSNYVSKLVLVILYMGLSLTCKKTLQMKLLSYRAGKCPNSLNCCKM